MHFCSSHLRLSPRGLGFASFRQFYPSFFFAAIGGQRREAAGRCGDMWMSSELLQEQQQTSQDMESFFPLQRFVLATLYYSLQGHSWEDNESWLEPGSDPCKWHSSSPGSRCIRGRRMLRSLQETARMYYWRLSLFQNNVC